MDLYAYLQIPVEEIKYKYLNTHCGLYKFERLPFRVKVAPAIFQKVMDTILSCLDFSVANLDDILMNSKGLVYKVFFWDTRLWFQN